MDNRSLALAKARYLSTILSSVMGKDMAPNVVVTMHASGLSSRYISLTLSLEDCQILADALNREPEVK